MVTNKSNSSLAVLILAAGKGTRMKSKTPKVLHQLLGKPIISHVLNAARYLEPAAMVVVTGYGAELVEAAVKGPGVVFARQPQMLGTGHAVGCAKEALAQHNGLVVILPGDVPLVSPQTLIDFVDAHTFLKADLSVLTVRVDNPGSYGRVVRDQSGWLSYIVEARDANEQELLIDEVNSGIYVADSRRLFESIANLKPLNSQKEYYLTDVAADFRSNNLLVAAIEGQDPFEVQGINDRRELAVAQATLKSRINESWLLAGVTMADPQTTYIEASVRLAQDVALGQGVVLMGTTTIGQGAVIGPYACLKDVEVEPGAVVAAHSCLEGVQSRSSETKAAAKQTISPKGATKGVPKGVHGSASGLGKAKKVKESPKSR
ncbi:MAG: NTP transferase domain-containing protein, partial [Deltaproteobacteria bacterium]|nr:NTP transferase domain-containing protein [Deltaproteobacteria bacterium]